MQKQDQMVSDVKRKKDDDLREKKRKDTQKARYIADGVNKANEEKERERLSLLEKLRRDDEKTEKVKRDKAEYEQFKNQFKKSLETKKANFDRDIDAKIGKQGL